MVIWSVSPFAFVRTGFGENKKPTAGWVLCLALLSYCPQSTSNGLHSLHPLFDGGFSEVCSLLELFQYAGPLVFLFESFEGAIDRFILCNYNSYQTLSPPLSRT